MPEDRCDSPNERSAALDDVSERPATHPIATATRVSPSSGRTGSDEADEPTNDRADTDDDAIHPRTRVP